MKKTFIILILSIIVYSCKSDKEKEIEQFIGIFGKNTWSIKKIVFYESNNFNSIDSTINFQDANIYFSGDCVQDGSPCKGTQKIYGVTSNISYDPKSNAYDKQIILVTSSDTKPILTLQGSYDVQQLDANKRIFSGSITAYKKDKWAKIYLEK
jgi:hypothetical protein